MGAARTCRRALAYLIVKLNVAVGDVVDPEVPVTGTVVGAVPDAVVTVTYKVPLCEAWVLLSPR